jgi:hypothetical protein
MNNLEELFDDLSDQDLARVHGRVVKRGTQIRRRSFTTRTVFVGLVVCAVAVPLSLASVQRRTPNGGTPVAIQTTTAGPFRDVAWKQYFNPQLNVTKVHFPGNIGCNPGESPTFHVVVQQVTYIRDAGSMSPIALALVHCNANNPPSSLYAFTFPRGATQPHVLQSLLAPPTSGYATVWYGSRLSISGDAVVLAVRGVTGTDRAGQCCPNVAGTMRWILNGTHFVKQRGHITSLQSTDLSQ